MRIVKNLLPIAFLFIGAVAHSQSSQSTTVYSYSASGGYAPNGNLMNYVDSVTGTWSMQYDGLNRLLNAGASATAPGYFQGLSLQWKYDSFGNRTEQTPSGANVVVPTAITASYNANNQIQSSSVPGVGPTSYDGAGNQTFDGINTITYDAENRVCAEFNSITGVVTQYLYNAEGQRVAKGHPVSGSSLPICPTGPADVSITETYVLGINGEQVTQVDGSGNWQHTNVYGGGQLLATYDQEGNQQLLHFNIADPLGTKRIQTDYSGAVELSSISLPFGDGLIVTGNGVDATQHHFTGKERDSESGLDNFGARYFGSTMGRFMSPDPLMASAKVWDPQTWNRYAYARNNPLSNIDPTGLAEVNAADCAKDKACVTVNVNVIYDKNANGGKGVSDSQKARFEKNQLQNAKDQYGNADIHLNVTYTAGEINSKGNLTGVDKGSLNVFVTDSGGPVSASSGGYALSRINVNSSNNDDLSHEMAHHFMGDMSSALGRTLSQDPTGISRIIDNMFTDVTNDTGRAIMNNVTPHLPNYPSGAPMSVFNPQAREFQKSITPQTHP